VHENYPESGCCLAIELKKFFMNEWTDELYDAEHKAIARALAATRAGLMESLVVLGAQ
jgi:hypothetical protein